MTSARGAYWPSAHAHTSVVPPPPTRVEVPLGVRVADAGLDEPRRPAGLEVVGVAEKIEGGLVAAMCRQRAVAATYRQRAGPGNV